MRQTLQCTGMSKIRAGPSGCRLQGAADKTMHFGLPHTWDHPMYIVLRNYTNQGQIWKKGTETKDVFLTYTFPTHVHASRIFLKYGLRKNYKMPFGLTSRF